MPLNERDTRQQLIDPKLEMAGWEIERELCIGPGRVNFSGDSPDSMYDSTQAIIADYLLRYRGVPLAILEAKAESISMKSSMEKRSTNITILISLILSSSTNATEVVSAIGLEFSSTLEVRYNLA